MVLVTVLTASSNSGAQAVKTLLEKGAKVRAVFRSLEKAKIFEPSPNLKIVTGVDASKPETLKDCFVGANFGICVTPHFDFAKDSELTINMCEAASKAGAHIVYVGSWTVRAPETTIAKRFVPTEAYLKALSTPWTSLRSGYFSGNYAALFGKDDIYFPELTVPPVDPADIGRVAAAICMDESSKHNGKYYDISGPENLSTQQIVDKVSKATGRSLTYHPVPIANLTPPHPPAFLIELLKDIDEKGLPCSPTTMDLAGVHTSFDTYLANNLSAFSGSSS